MPIGAIPVYKMETLTWNLFVDSGFIFLIRLHFCEINYFGNNQFSIYIENQLAEENATISLWTGLGGTDIPAMKHRCVLGLGCGCRTRQFLKR